MSTFGGFVFAGVALIGWIGIGWWMGRRNNKRLAASRPGMTSAEAIRAMVAEGSDDDVAALVIDWISLYYGPETTPNAADRMKDDVAICSEDIEFFVADFFRDNQMPPPTRKRPEVLPNYNEVTLTSFAVYLTERRALLGKKRAAA